MKKITLFIAALVMSVMSYALNPFAYALSSSLSEDGATLTVSYSLNAEATAVSVVVLDGEEVVKTVPCEGLAAGEYTVEVPTEGLPTGKDLTWKVEVQGTSVEAPTQHETLYSLYHPSSVDIDNNPENPTFGLILANEAMHEVKDKSGYLSSGYGAGIYAFTPSFEPILNGEEAGFNGGITFVNTNSTGTCYAPRRIRISDDGRIFVTSLDVNGTYLWELNPENLNEWTPIFTDTQMNDLAELVDAEGNFVAGPNAGFDVRGEGESLQLLMLSGNTNAFAYAPNGFKCAEYNLGTATSWTGAPTRIIWDSIYALVPTQSQVQYDAEGGVWFAQYRGTTTDDQPGMVHWTAEGVEDFKWLRDMTRNAGIRYDGEFAKMIVAGNNGAAKKATLYTVTKDEEGKPVFTEELVIDMAVVGSNLNDFAFDYAGNLYALGNSAEKIVAWAMPYSGLVATPAASQYTFQLAGSVVEPVEMVGVVKRALQYYDATIVLTHEEDGTAHIYNVVDGVVAEVSQEGVVVDTENAGEYLALADIAITEDGKLVGVNHIMCQSGDDYVDADFKRGESRFYIWNDLAGDPALWFSSKMSSNWFRSKQGYTMALKGNSVNCQILLTGPHGLNGKARFSVYNVIEGQYVEPDVNNNDYYHFHNGPADINGADMTTIVGTNYQLNASPLAAGTWILDGDLIDPYELIVPETNNVALENGAALSADLGKKYNGATYVTVGEQVLMVAPYATEFGVLAGAKVLDITAGLDAAEEVTVAYLDSDVEATAAATAVQVVEGGLVVNLVADATIYTLNVELSSTPSYDLELPVEISNLTTDLMTVGDLSFLQLNGSNDMEGVEVMLFIPDYTGEDKEYALDLGNYYLTLGGVELTLVEGALTQITDPEKGATYAGRVVATAEEDGQLMTVALDLTMYSIPPVEIEIEDVTITVDEESAIALFTADWEGTPLSVEVSGFEEAEFAEYPECWLTLGDDVNWVDAAAGPVAIVIEDGVAMLEGEFVSYATGQTYYVMLSGNMPVKEEPVVELVGVVKRALQYYDATIVLTHEEDGTAHIYNVVDGVATEVSQEGVIAVDPENAGDLLAISDIALTEDGKLVAVNQMICQAGDDYVDEGYKRGENRFYIWNSLEEAPAVWFKSNMYANWFRSNNGQTMAIKGTSDNAEIALTGYHATSSWARIATYKVIDGVYTEPADAATGNDNYTWCEGPAAGDIDDNVIGTTYELNASPLAAANWIIDGNLVDPIEYVAPAEIKAIISTLTPLSADLGKKYNGATYVTVGEQVLMVAPYATEFGVLAGAKVLDITAGLDAAEEVTVAYLDSDIEATAAATAVQVVEGGLVVKLVADGTIYTLNVKLSTSGPEYIPIEEEVTDLMIDTEYLTLAGTGNYYGFEVYLTLGQDNMDGTFALDPENSFVTFGGVDANFIEGYAYDIDLYAPAATAVTRIELDGQYYEVTFYMSNKPVEAIDIVIEDATVAIDTIPMFGDVVEYALRMTANWTNPADGVTYPVLVEVPVYYPEATEPSEIMSTVTVGGWADTDPWLGFGEGYLTVTTVDGVVTVAGLVENTWAAFAANITISGKLPQGPTTGLDNVQVEVKALKTIKNGQLIIVRDGKEFNAQGAVVK